MLDLTSYTYSFEELIRGKFLYVDKTEYIWNMIRPATAGYFLSRPRRFGKSLTVSTLKAVFQGKKELFKGLAIYKGKKNCSRGWLFTTSLMTGSSIPSFIWT